MDPKSLTDNIIISLLTTQKEIRNGRAREVVKAKHKERNYDVHSSDGRHTFSLFVRQSTLIQDSFSCGLVWHASSTQKVILTRYNGADHPHGNPLEGEEFSRAFHIHTATERYIAVGRRAEHYAKTTDRYSDVETALKCLCTDCNIIWPKSSDTPATYQGDLF